MHTTLLVHHLCPCPFCLKSKDFLFFLDSYDHSFEYIIKWGSGPTFLMLERTSTPELPILSIQFFSFNCFVQSLFDKKGLCVDYSTYIFGIAILNHKAHYIPKQISNSSIFFLGHLFPPHFSSWARISLKSPITNHECLPLI